MIPLMGFSPDVEPTTQGAMLECQNLIPSERGMRAAPSAATVGYDALASACRGSAVVRGLTGNSRFFAGSASQMYEASGVTWSSVGSGFTLGADDRWTFAGFGNASLIASPSTVVHRSLSGAFTPISGAPKAKCLVSVRGFVLAFATEDPTYGSSPDRWWCSALNDETDWTPDVSTQSNTGRLVGGSGPINAAMRFGDEVVVYKNRAMFRGVYVGDAEVWRFEQVGFDVGCVGPEAVADTSTGHVFVGSDNIYSFDGTRPVAIATGVIRQWWMNNSSSEYRYRTKLLWDRDNSLVWVFYPSSGSGGDCDACIVYHTPTQRWGRVNLSAQAAVNYVSPGITYDSGSPLITSYDTGPEIPYDSPFWLSQKSSPAIFGAGNNLLSLSGEPGQWSFQTNDFGDEAQWSYCTSLHMRFSRLADVVSCTARSRSTSGGDVSSSAAAPFDGSKFPLRVTSRFHRFLVEGEGPAEFSGVRPSMIDAGVR